MTDVYFNEAYGKLYEKIDNGICETFHYEDVYGVINNIYIKRLVPWLIDGIQYYDVITPYGYGGPLILASDDKDALIIGYIKAWEKHCLDSKIIAEFVRFHLFDNQDIRERFYCDVIYMSDNVVVNTDRTQEELWASFERKVRNNVKKALKNELSVVIDTTGERLDEFLGIYYKTLERKNATSYYYFNRDYFENVHRTIPGQFVYFHVLKDEKVVSTELVLCSEKYAYSFLGGTYENYYEFRSNDILKYEIIKWCAETGRKAFVLGGGYHKGDGIYRYKKSFAPDGDVPFFVGKKIWNQTVYKELVSVRSTQADWNAESAYFPLYRS